MSVSTTRIQLKEAPDERIAYLLKDLQYSLGSFADPNALLMYPYLVWKQPSVEECLKQLNNAARKDGRQLIVAVLHDEDDSYQHYDWLLILRTSLQQRFRQPLEWALPYVWESKHDAFFPSPIYSNPTIGFCGLNSHWRKPLLDCFVANENVKTDFLIRDQFWGGKPDDPQLIMDFWDNLRRNAFALAPRGAGNFSMRFFQAMSMGRIPVLVDTDNVLPLEHLINWKEIIIMGSTPDECVNKVLDLWEKGKVLETQRICFDVYHQFLDKGNYLKNLLPELIRLKKSKPLKIPFWKQWKR